MMKILVPKMKKTRTRMNLEKKKRLQKVDYYTDIVHAFSCNCLKPNLPKVAMPRVQTASKSLADVNALK